MKPVESHPFEPYLPPDAKILIMGTSVSPAFSPVVARVWQSGIRASRSMRGTGSTISRYSFIPFPSELVVPPAAYLAMQPDSTMNIYAVTLIATAGALVGALVNYYLALWVNYHKYEYKPIIGVIYKPIEKFVGVKYGQGYEVKHSAYIFCYGYMSACKLLSRIMGGKTDCIPLCQQPFRPYVAYR